MTDPAPGQGIKGLSGKWMIWIGLALFLAIIALGLFRSQNSSLSLGDAMPAFTLQTFAGEIISPTDLADKVVVVNFWASWCKPCEEEAADLEAAWQASRERGVVFLGVDYVDTETEARSYLEKFNITYPNGPDLGTRISQAFKTRGVPETYIFDQEGKLVHVQIGPFTSQQDIMSILNRIIPHKEG